MQKFNLHLFQEKYVNPETKSSETFESVYAWLGSLNLAKYGWLAGGAVRRLITGQSMDSDFDLFFKNENALIEFEQKIEEDRNVKILKEIRGEHNVTYILDVKGFELQRVKLQLIKIQYYNTLEDVLNSFDYTLCQVGIDGEDLVLGDTTLWDLGRERIVVHKITYPVASLRRLLKYTSQGFYACQGALVDLLQTVKDNPKPLDEDVKYID